MYNIMYNDTQIQKSLLPKQLFILKFPTVFIAILASKLSTQLRTRSTGLLFKPPVLKKNKKQYTCYFIQIFTNITQSLLHDIKHVVYMPH